MAHKDAGLRRKGENLADRAVKRTGIAARKIRPCRAIVRHEQRIADKGHVIDQIGDTGRRVPRRVHHGDLRVAEGQRLAIVQKHVEHFAIGVIFDRTKDGKEGFLDLRDAGTDDDLAAGFSAQVISRRQVISMRVGVEDPVDLQALRACEGEHFIR